ncbi:hypothetical protein PR202_gb26104 [Eleusine coracana subsp. coracana]|uniref:Uncharacterized protein n=1 Tax=Eleusine coracana subsp. coracana TaxID=191504 RepID=A0AAV5FQZ6_ELECO|nr:hypothetical protein PR202_gb26104 [Eleusine coracana subsp. coracana]
MPTMFLGEYEIISNNPLVDMERTCVGNMAGTRTESSRHSKHDPAHITAPMAMNFEYVIGCIKVHLLYGPGHEFGYLWQPPLLKCLCDARRTEEASDMLLRMMPEFACVPNVVMYWRLLKCFCDDRNSWRALEPHRLMGRKGCSPDVVVYSTVINDLFKEGKVTKSLLFLTGGGVGLLFPTGNSSCSNQRRAGLRLSKGGGACIAPLQHDRTLPGEQSSPTNLWRNNVTMSSSSRVRLSSFFATRPTATPPSKAQSSCTPHLVLAAMAERARCRTLGPKDGHHLLEELLEQATPVSEHALNDFLAALARVLPSASCSDGPMLAISLFNHMSRGRGPQYEPGHGFGYLWQPPLLKCLCDARRREEASDMLLHMMPEFASTYNSVIDALCKTRAMEKAESLLFLTGGGVGLLFPTGNSSRSNQRRAGLRLSKGGGACIAPLQHDRTLPGEQSSPTNLWRNNVTMSSSSRVRLSSFFATRPTATPPSKAQSSCTPHLVLAAMAERARCRTLGPKDGHHLLEELLEQATPVSEHALNDFLAALARVLPSASCSDGPMLAISLFNHMSRGRGPQVAPPTAYTYAILIDCCGRACRSDLALAFFGRLLSMSLGMDLVTSGNLPSSTTYNSVIDALCKTRAMEKAEDGPVRLCYEHIQSDDQSWKYHLTKLFTTVLFKLFAVKSLLFLTGGGVGLLFPTGNSSRSNQRRAGLRLSKGGGACIAPLQHDRTLPGEQSSPTNLWRNNVTMSSSSRVRLSSFFATRPTATPPSKAQSSCTPHLVLAAMAERARCRTLGPKDGHHLLEELLEQATPVSEHALNDFLAALARVLPSASCSDGPMLAISLFNHMSRGRGPQVAPPTAYTYAILIDCCGRACRSDLALAFFGRLLSMSLGMDLVTSGNLPSSSAFAMQGGERRPPTCCST